MPDEGNERRRQCRHQHEDPKAAGDQIVVRQKDVPGTAKQEVSGQEFEGEGEAQPDRADRPRLLDAGDPVVGVGVPAGRHRAGTVASGAA